MNYAEKYKRDQRTIRDLRRRILDLEQENREVRQDRDLFRTHFVENFNWFSKLCNERVGPNLVSFLQCEAMWLRRFKWWHFEAKYK